MGRPKMVLEDGYTVCRVFSRSSTYRLRVHVRETYWFPSIKVPFAPPLNLLIMFGKIGANVSYLFIFESMYLHQLGIDDLPRLTIDVGITL